MTTNDDLTLAKQIIADHQIAMARMMRQMNSSFVHNPDGVIVHTACGSPLIVDEGDILPGCECFEA